MLYSILIYDSEAVLDTLGEEYEAACLAKHAVLQQRLSEGDRLKAVAKLMPTTAATTLRKGPGSAPLVLDGPFAETKEQLLGIYVLEADSLDEAVEAAALLPLETGTLEIRPIGWFTAGERASTP